MEEIKEVALRVAEEADEYIKANPLKSRDLYFASRLLAELQKDAEPVARINVMNAHPGKEARLFPLVDIEALPFGTHDLYFAHPQPKAAMVPFKLVDIVSQGYEGWANLIYTGPEWEGGPVALCQPFIADALRHLIEAAPSLPTQSEAPDLLPPMGIRNDRDMLNYLDQAFSSEHWNCPRCGHGEDTATMDSAKFLREYLATAQSEGKQK